MTNDTSHHPWAEALVITLCLVGVMSLSPVALSYAKRLVLPPVPQTSVADALPASTPLPLISLEHHDDPAPQATHTPAPQVHTSHPTEGTGHKVTVTKATPAVTASSHGSGAAHAAPVAHTATPAPTQSPAHTPVTHAVKTTPYKTTQLTHKSSHTEAKSSSSHHATPTTHHEAAPSQQAHAETPPPDHEPAPATVTPPHTQATAHPPAPEVTKPTPQPITYKQAPLGGAQDGAATKGLTQVLLGLLGVLGLVFLVAKLAKTYLPLATGEVAVGGNQHKLQVLDTLTLGAHHQLKLVAGPQGEQLLLAQTAQGLSLIKSWPANSGATSAQPPAADTLTTLDDYLDEAVIPLKSKRG
jgi:hypothetical protein